MKRPAWIFLFLVALTGIFFYVLFTEVFAVGKEREELEVAFLDVGQGDAIYARSPAGTELLVDGGRDGVVLSRLGEVMGPFDRTIDVVLATHPDADHIGGLIDVLKRYAVKQIIMTDNVNKTPAYDAFMHAVQEEGAAVIYAHRGQVFDLGVGKVGSTTLTILFPDRSVKDLESNMSSIVARLSYGNADVLLTGDSPEAIETYLVDQSESVLQSEVLKVGHHGSRTSTGPLFLEAVRPQYAIISAGKDNDYGHPHKEVLETLRTHNVAIKNTADFGTIILESDGERMWFK